MQNSFDLNWTLRSSVSDEGARKQGGHLEDVEIVITLSQPVFARVAENRSQSIVAIISPSRLTDERSSLCNLKTSLVLVLSSDPPFL